MWDDLDKIEHLDTRSCLKFLIGGRAGFDKKSFKKSAKKKIFEATLVEAEMDEPMVQVGNLSEDVREMLKVYLPKLESQELLNYK